MCCLLVCSCVWMCQPKMDLFQMRASLFWCDRDTISSSSLSTHLFSTNLSDRARRPHNQPHDTTHQSNSIIFKWCSLMPKNMFFHFLATQPQHWIFCSLCCPPINSSTSTYQKAKSLPRHRIFFPPLLISHWTTKTLSCRTTNTSYIPILCCSILVGCFITIIINTSSSSQQYN